MVLHNKLSYILSISLFIIPILSFLNKINLPQITTLEIYLISASQFFFLVITFLLSVLIHYFFLKKKIQINFFFLINSLIFFLLFFFQNIKSLLFFEKQNSFLDEMITFIIFILIYFFLISLSGKIFRFLSRFLLIFFLFQVSYFMINLITIKFYKGNNVEASKIVNAHDIDINSLKKNKQSGNIFFIILDGMMTLESAEKLKIIKSEKEIINSLNKDDIEYKKNFLVNYDQTYLSLASLLQGSYPITEKSKKYRTRKDFYPFLLLNQKKDNNFFKILRKTEKDFFWLGNSSMSCQNNIYINCIKQDKSLKFFSTISLFYFDSILIYGFNLIPVKHVNKNESVNFLKSPENIFKQNNIYFYIYLALTCLIFLIKM